LEAARARAGVGLVSNLARTVWSAALIIRETEFAEILRRAQLAPGSASSLHQGTGWTVPDRLHAWELSFDPALQRTCAAVISMDMLKEPIPPEARDWVTWVTTAMHACQRIAATCWTGIPADIRQLFLDFDEILPPGARGEISDLRRDQPDRPAMRLAGLDSPPVRAALRELYSAVQASPSSAEARQAARVLRSRADLMRTMLEVRTRLESGVRTVRAGEKPSDDFERARVTIARAYDDFPELSGPVAAFRRHNQCVTRILCTLLGAAEQLQLAALVEMPDAITERFFDDERRLDMTIRGWQMALIRPTHPIWLELGSPLDGLYLVKSHVLAFAGSEENDLGVIAFDG